VSIEMMFEFELELEPGFTRNASPLRNPVRGGTLGALDNPEVAVDNVDNVDADLPLPLPPLCPLASREWGAMDEDLEEEEEDREPSLSLLRGGRSISPSVGLGGICLFMIEVVVNVRVR
jgi:hypothetical protein